MILHQLWGASQIDGVSPSPVLLFVFVLANAAITAGYAFLAIAVIPKVAVQLLRTKLGGIGFFLLCGLTHAHMAWAALFDQEHGGYAYMAVTPAMLAIHVPQAICVWLFVWGIYVEMGEFGLLRLKRDAEPDAAAVTDPG